MARIEVEVEEAEVTCRGCGRKELKVIHSITRRYDPGGDRLVAERFSAPESWRQVWGSLFAGNHTIFLCDNCAPAAALAFLTAIDELCPPFEGGSGDEQMKLDMKFHGIVVKNKDGTVVPQDQWVVFLAKDNAFLPTLRFYREECERQGCGKGQLNAVDELIGKAEAWRAAHPDLCKKPDVRDGELA